MPTHSATRFLLTYGIFLCSGTNSRLLEPTLQKQDFFHPPEIHPLIRLYSFCTNIGVYFFLSLKKVNQVAKKIEFAAKK